MTMKSHMTQPSFPELYKFVPTVIFMRRIVPLVLNTLYTLLYCVLYIHLHMTIHIQARFVDFEGTRRGVCVLRFVCACGLVCMRTDVCVSMRQRICKYINRYINGWLRPGLSGFMSERCARIRRR